MTVPLVPFLHDYAEVIVRVGLNLQPGQRLLIAEPFELQGVAPAAAVLVEAISTVARAVGAARIDVLWSDPERVRAAAGRRFDPEFAERLAANAARMDAAVRRKDAVLFLQGSHPRLWDGLTPSQAARFRDQGWGHYGPIAQQLVAGRTNWSAAPAPTPDWAAVVFPQLAPAEALAALWRAVLQACRIEPGCGVETWRQHLAVLNATRDTMNTRRVRGLRFRGDGTDLVVDLPPDHVWCTAGLRTPAGISFVANLPTEEVFTAPDRDTAEGVVRVARPVALGGAVIDGIELEFRGGQVVGSSARSGGDHLQRLLATDPGARRLGEVAIVSPRTVEPNAETPPLFFHPLLDENALSHVALGEGYPFCVGEAGAGCLNRSLMHLDLPIAAEVSIEDP